MSTATEPLTGDERLTLRHAIETRIEQMREIARSSHRGGYWWRRIEELRSAARKLGLHIDEART